MADETPNPEKMLTPEEVEAKNKEVAQKLADQDAAGRSNTPNPIDVRKAEDALDSLAAEVTKKKELETAPKPEPTPEEKAAADKAAAEKSEADKKATEKTEADKKVAEETTKRATEYFKDSPTLPPGASPKSAEAFNAVKVKAAQEIEARDKKILDFETKLKELNKKLENPVPQELQKELEELRTFRARLDVEADPTFKAFDKTVSSSQEFIYAQLLKNPSIKPDLIAEIKKHGGPEMVDLSKVWDQVKDPTLQRIVESKIADIEHAKWQKEEAIKTTKANVKEYVQKREQEFSKSATAHTEATKTRLTELTGSLKWFAPITADAKADDAAKKTVEAHNKFVADVREKLDYALTDDSSEMRAIQLVGMAQLLYLQRMHEAALAKVSRLESELKTANESVEKFKNASVSRLRESGAPPNPRTTVAKKDDFNTTAGDALDKLRDTVMAERERAQAGT
jgi:hypothetical protein